LSIFVNRMRGKKMDNKSLDVLDLFCGIGGLSYGLHTEGFNIVAGVDSRYGFDLSTCIRSKQ